MRERKIVFTFLLCAFIFVMLGCATPIEKQYPDRWEKTKVGMTLDEFKTVWKEAKYKEDREGTEVYVLYGTIAGFVASNANETFIFRNNKLEKWRASGGSAFNQ